MKGIMSFAIGTEAGVVLLVIQRYELYLRLQEADLLHDGQNTKEIDHRALVLQLTYIYHHMQERLAHAFTRFPKVHLQLPTVHNVAVVLNMTRGVGRIERLHEEVHDWKKLVDRTIHLLSMVVQSRKATGPVERRLDTIIPLKTLTGLVVLHRIVLILERKLMDLTKLLLSMIVPSRKVTDSAVLPLVELRLGSLEVRLPHMKRKMQEPLGLSAFTHGRPLSSQWAHQLLQLC